MSFRHVLDALPLSRSAKVRGLAELLEPKSSLALEQMAQEARSLTLKNFGRTMHLFAPLYLSNECVNSCRYCGFSRDNPILRLTLEVDEVEAEARHLAAEGFRHVLLVAGEHPKFVGRDYLARCVEKLAPNFSSIAIEVAPMTEEDYRPIVAAGADGLVVYQETYDREIYATLHTAGPKRDFDWRLDCAERGYAAGFHRIGVGALFGLAPWRQDAVALAAHVEYLLKHCWQAQISVSFPRLRPAAGEFSPPFLMSDRELAQLVCAFRIVFPQINLVLAGPRENGALRDALIPLGITTMSAGSHTEPGGYTGQGQEGLHRTVRGRAVACETAERQSHGASEQFQISDERTAAEVAASLREKGFDPIWKDWDQALAAI